MKRANRFRSIGSALVVALGSSFGAASLAEAAAPIVVSPGESIQAAIDAAAPGSTILVRAGVYAENLEIYKDDLTLRGAGPGRTILVQPAHPVQRFCTPDPNDPFVAGICATGEIDFNTAQISRFLRRTRISGFSVRNFTGIGIVLLGVEQGAVEHNEVTGNVRGIHALNSTRSRIAGNVVLDNDGSGILIDKVEFIDPGSLPPADATVLGNRVSGNRGPGIFVFDADGGRITANASTGNCGGMLFVNLAATGRDWSVSFNSVAYNNLVCPPSGGPPLSGLGIGVTGASELRIEHNLVLGNQPAGPSLPSGGIAVESSAPFGGSDPNDVQVHGNVLHGNLPVDLIWDGTGTGVGFSSNVCASSTPAGLCSN